VTSGSKMFCKIKLQKESGVELKNKTSQARWHHDSPSK
jgi:hypothetical protein